MRSTAGATLIKPYDDPYIIAGQGTIGIELLEQAEEYGIELDGIVVPCGGGGFDYGNWTRGFGVESADEDLRG